VGNAGYSTTHEEKPSFIEKKKKLWISKYVPWELANAYDQANVSDRESRLIRSPWLAQSQGTPVISGGCPANYT
jgi:hypothetical protein